MTAERSAWYDQVAEALEKLKAVLADVALQPTLRESDREDIDTHTAEIAEVHEQLVAKSAGLFLLSAKHSKQTNELSRAKLQNAAGSTVCTF